MPGSPDRRRRRRRTRGRLRLFVAADPPTGVGEAAAAWGRETARATVGLRPVPALNLHITLAFIGDRPESDLDPVLSALADVLDPASGVAAPHLSLGAPVWLPPRRPRALALEIHDDRGELAALRHELALGLERAVGWRSARGFRPHLTCARTARGFDTGALRLPPGPAADFVPTAVTLYASILRPEGALYEMLERFGLPDGRAAAG